MTETLIALREWLKEKDISEAELGKALGYDYTTIWRIVNGKRSLSSEFRTRMKNVYGLAVAVELFPDDFREEAALLKGSDA